MLGTVFRKGRRVCKVDYIVIALSDMKTCASGTRNPPTLSISTEVKSELLQGLQSWSSPVFNVMPCFAPLSSGSSSTALYPSLDKLILPSRPLLFFSHGQESPSPCLYLVNPVPYIQCSSQLHPGSETFRDLIINFCLPHHQPLCTRPVCTYDDLRLYIYLRV